MNNNTLLTNFNVKPKNISSSFTEPSTIEEKIEILMKLIEEKNRYIEEIRNRELNEIKERMNVTSKEEEREIPIIKKVEEEFDEEKENNMNDENLILNFEKSFNNNSGYIRKSSKLFLVKPEVTAKQFVKNVLFAIDDASLKKKVVSKDFIEKVEELKNEKRTLNLKDLIGRFLFFKFL
ncbi:MAG: hypothetical protein QXG00_04210 [Candidatus Woesearchaeota archaeon]